MVWLNPFYPSPQRDNGYDISDYTAVNPVFGDMADFEEMVRVAKEHKIDFMLDMVLNHCSTEHEWFQKALAGDKYYQDFFFIQDQPTDWLSKFGIQPLFYLMPCDFSSFVLYMKRWNRNVSTPSLILFDEQS